MSRWYYKSCVMSNFMPNWRSVYSINLKWNSWIYIISKECLFMDPKKIQTIMEWRKPNTVQGVQYFLGFANFYRLFIQDYSKIITPLTHLTCKDKLEWSAKADQAFQDLKTAFTTAPILIYLDFSKPFFLESDGPNYALGMVLSQNREDERFHLLHFIHESSQL
jgi:hypothetical protein